MIIKNLMKKTPLEIGFEEIKNNLFKELLDSTKRCSPKFFENLVFELRLMKNIIDLSLIIPKIF